MKRLIIIMLLFSGVSWAVAQDVAYEREGDLLVKKVTTTDTIASFEIAEGVDESDFDGSDLKTLWTGGVVKKSGCKLLYSVWPLQKRPYGSFYELDGGTVYESREGYTGPAYKDSDLFWFNLLVFFLMLILFILSTWKRFLYFTLVTTGGLVLNILIMGYLLPYILSTLIWCIVTFVYAGYLLIPKMDEPWKRFEHGDVMIVFSFIMGFVIWLVGASNAAFVVTSVLWHHVLLHVGLCASVFLLGLLYLILKKRAFSGSASRKMASR